MQVRSSSAKLLLPVLAIFLWSSLSAGQAQASQYLGLCNFLVTVKQTEAGVLAPPYPTFQVTMALSRVTNGYYLAQGYVGAGGDGYPFVMNGGGTLVNVQGKDWLIFTVNESKEHGGNDRDTGTMNIRLDKTTFKGTFYDIGHDFNAGMSGAAAFSQRFSAGDIAVQGPIPPLTASSPAPQQLLLQ